MRKKNRIWVGAAEFVDRYRASPVTSHDASNCVDCLRTTPTPNPIASIQACFTSLHFRRKRREIGVTSNARQREIGNGRSQRSCDSFLRPQTEYSQRQRRWIAHGRINPNQSFLLVKKLHFFTPQLIQINTKQV